MKPVQHLYNALNAMGPVIPSVKIDFRDEIIDAQDVALELDEEDRIAVCKVITLLRTRIAALDRISEAWGRSVEQIKLAIKELESNPDTTPNEPYGMPK
jgi:hypothetical protein